MSASAASVATTRGSVRTSDMGPSSNAFSLPPGGGGRDGAGARRTSAPTLLSPSPTGAEKEGGPGSEEAERLGRVADQHVLGLLVVVEHHLVRLAADARLLVAAEGRVCRIGMVAIGPHATGLD